MQGETFIWYYPVLIQPSHHNLQTLTSDTAS